jgi:4-alpha-glucanotransferase
MRDTALERLARAAGLAVDWTDAAGEAKRVSPDSLRAVLTALDLAADSDAAVKDSLRRLANSSSEMKPLQVARQGTRIKAPVKARRLRLISEDGQRHDVRNEDGRLPLPDSYGYYQLDDSEQRIAVVPRKAWMPDHSLWGVGVQVYALKAGSTSGFGDFAALADFCGQAAAAGAGAVAINPVHALFGALPDHISPYAPSTRLWLNPLYAALPGKAKQSGAGLIDWPHASRQKWHALRQAFTQAGKDPDFAAFVRQGGERLLAQARFEMLDARFRAQGCESWRQWPAPYRDAQSRAVRALSAKDPEIAFHLFAQWQADRSLAVAQASARRAGMPVGLIADMAVGMDPAGSHAWSAPKEVLRGLTVGAPPDIFNARGQNWGLTNLSPRGLIDTGYAGFIATLRAAMRHAGGIRLDHAMGLQRLWVIPQGADPADGVYLHYPLQELLGLIALESQCHRAMVVAEDLGTVPEGFREKLARAAILGMRVLWFERDARGGFLPPQKWDAQAAALSTTHDLPTLAGWWSGHDLKWRRRLKLDAKPEKARHERQRDRKRLWASLKKTSSARGPMPDQPPVFVDAAFAALAAAPSPLKLLPIEDFLGEKEQPNIPGTISEHPNWRRRLRTAKPFDNKAARRRAAILRRS